MADSNKSIVTLDNLNTFKSYIEAEINNTEGSSLSGTVGGSAQPIYLSDGKLTALSGTIGSSTKPVYLSSGTITALSGTVGDYGSSPVCLQDGDFVPLNSCGSTTTPIYIDANGCIKKCTKSLQNSVLHYLFCFDEHYYNRYNEYNDIPLETPILMYTNLTEVDLVSALSSMHEYLIQSAANGNFSYSDISSLGLVVAAKEFNAEEFRYGTSSAPFADLLYRYTKNVSSNIAIVGVLCQDVALLYFMSQADGECDFCIKPITQIIYEILEGEDIEYRCTDPTFTINLRDLTVVSVAQMGEINNENVLFVT